MSLAPAIAIPWATVPRIPRLFVVDDDELFCRHLQRIGRRLNISVRCFHPDRDFGRLPQDGEFDAAIIDYDLGTLLGTQLSALYLRTPVLLVSVRDRSAQDDGDRWPLSVHGFAVKSTGAGSILCAAVELGRLADAEDS